MSAPALGRTWWRRSARFLTPIAGGVLSSLAAGVVMLLMRITLEVRTVPERVLEAALIFTPPEVFEAGLQRYGFDAKRYALMLTILGMLLLLAGLGAWAIGRRWSIRAIIFLGLALWLFVMLVVMPLSEAGPFALDLIRGAEAAIGVHLAAGLSFAASLAYASAIVHGASTAAAHRSEHVHPGSHGRPVFAATPPTAAPSRRSALVLSAGAVSVLVGTFLSARWRTNAASGIVVVEPEPVGSRGGTPNTTPASGPPASRAPDVATRSAAVAQATVAPPTVAPLPTTIPAPVIQPHPTPTTVPAIQFDPPADRQLARDHEGVVLKSGRRPGQLAETITNTDDFYVVSKNAAQDPFIELAGWRLRVDGEVARPIEIDYRSLRNLPSVEIVKTLECISNFVTKCELVPFGCDLISTAQWKGTRVRDILALAGGLKPGVSSLMAIAADEFTTALPLEAALDPNTLLVYEMNGRPLSREHGYPARVLVPGRYGMKNAKWVIALRPLARARRLVRQAKLDQAGRRQDDDAHRHASPRCRAAARHTSHSRNRYAGDRGIQKVEFSADGGEAWRIADLIDRAVGRDVWVRWEGSFTLPPGETLTLMTRATDGTGELQIELFSLPQPDGSTGWHSLEVRGAPGLELQALRVLAS